MGSGSNNNIRSLVGYGAGMGNINMGRTQQQSEQLQLQRQQQRLLNDLSLHQQQQQQQHTLFPNPIRPLQQQQQFAATGLGDFDSGPNVNLLQQQLELEQQIHRRRSSMSATRSLSPLGQLDQDYATGLTANRPHLPAGGGIASNNPNRFFGNTTAATSSGFARLTNTAPLAPPNPSMLSTLQQQMSSYATNQRPTTTSTFMNPDEAGMIQQGNDEMTRKDKKKRARTFPEKLMAAMIEHEDERAVAWLPDGKSFVIVSPDLFVNEVLGSDFKQAKYASFVRKLHRWGFTRLTSGTGTDCFHHPQFNRNYPDMSSRITCVPIKESSKESGVAESPTKSRSSKQISSTMSISKAISAGPVGVVDRPPSLAGVERFIRSRATEPYYDPTVIKPSNDAGADDKTLKVATTADITEPAMESSKVGTNMGSSLLIDPSDMNKAGADVGRRLHLLPIEEGDDTVSPSSIATTGGVPPLFTGREEQI